MLYEVITLFFNGLYGRYTTPVELYRATNAVSTRTKYNHRFIIVKEFNIVVCTRISKVQIIGLSRIFAGKGINLLHNRYNAARFTVVADVNKLLGNAMTIFSYNFV